MERLFEEKSGGTKVLVSETGGTVRNFVVDGKDVLYPWRMVGDKERGGLPICAPGFGLSPMWPKRHGFLRDLIADDVKLEKDRIKMSFYQPALEGYYPWRMQYLTVSEVQPDMLKTLLIINPLNNDSGEKATVLPGFHPYLACDDASKVKVYVAGKKFGGFSDEAKMFPLVSEEIMISIPGRRDVMINLGGAFFQYGQPQMVLWSDAREYFCVEPIIQDKNLLGTPKGIWLEKYQELRLEMSLSVI